jgi:hypothetical protein
MYNTLRTSSKLHGKVHGSALLPTVISRIDGGPLIHAHPVHVRTTRASLGRRGASCRRAPHLIRTSAKSSRGGFRRRRRRAGRRRTGRRRRRPHVLRLPGTFSRQRGGGSWSGTAKCQRVGGRARRGSDFSCRAWPRLVATRGTRQWSCTAARGSPRYRRSPAATVHRLVRVRVRVRVTVTVRVRGIGLGGMG